MWFLPLRHLVFVFSLVSFQDELRVVAEAVGEEGDREAVEPHRASVAPEHAVELQDRGRSSRTWEEEERGK